MIDGVYHLDFTREKVSYTPILRADGWRIAHWVIPGGKPRYRWTRP